MAEFYAHVIDGEISQVKVPKGSRFKGKSLGLESPDATYAKYGLYPQAGERPAYNAKTQVLTGPEYGWDARGKVVNLTWSVTDKPIDDIKAALLAKANKEEKVAETAGITLPDGTFIRTDEKTQNRLAQAASECRANPAMVFDWKMSTGNFVTLNAAAILTINAAVVAHVQKCLTAEKNKTATINACNNIKELSCQY